VRNLGAHRPGCLTLSKYFQVLLGTRVTLCGYPRSHMNRHMERRGEVLTLVVTGCQGTLSGLVNARIE